MSRRATLLLPLLAVLTLLTLPAASQAAASFKWNKGVRVESTANGGLDSVSCPTSSFCAAGDSKGNIYVTTSPSSTRNTWKGAAADNDGGQVTGISCPTSSFCAAVDSVGAFVYSTDPTKGKKSWSHPVRIDSNNAAGGGYVGLSSISCPSATLCVAVDNATDSNVVYSTDPTGGKTAWHSVALGAQAVSVDCPTVNLCVIGGAERWVSTDPSSSKGWTVNGTLSGETYESVDCVGTTLCVGIGYGNTTPGFSTASQTPTKSWSNNYEVETNPPIPGSSLLDTVGCTRGTCVAVDGNDNAFVTSTPVTGVWGAGAAIRSKASSSWTAISCTSGICVVVDSAGVETTGTLS